MNKKVPSILLAATMLFNVDSFYDISSRDQVNASLHFTSQRAYFYVEDTAWKDSWMNSVENLAQEFDRNIYPEITRIYGSEWIPGIDGDNRITILITPMNKEAGGYFNSADEFSGQGNNREMLYLNSDKIQNSLAPSFLAHEFQHLINFYQKKKLRLIDEETWLNEALSEYAPTAIGYTDYLENRMNRFLQDPSNSLIQWSNSPYDYAVVNIFMHYLVEQKGEAIINKIIRNNTIGIESIDNFQEIFTNWVIANYINDCQIDEKYCYKNLDFNLKPTANYTLFPASSLSVGVYTNQWSPHWYKISGLDKKGKILKLKFNAEGNFTIPVIIKNKSNQNKVEFMSIDKEIYITDFGKEINSVTLAPFSNQAGEFSFLASLVDEIEKEQKVEEPQELDREQFKKLLTTQINELKIQVLELQKELLLVRIQELKQRIADILAQRNDQIARS